MSDVLNRIPSTLIRNLLVEVRAIVNSHEQAKNLYLPRFAPDHNVFQFIAPDEMRLSTIIAWLLNPAAYHGQGGVFLRSFLEILGWTEYLDKCDQAHVQTEVSIKGGGRLDVLVCTDELEFAIENKPWAGDQDTQIKRYFEHFDQIGRSKYQVVYLTSKGTAPSCRSIGCDERVQRIESGQLRLWAYDKQILLWLAKCRAACRADRVSIFIDEFSRYVLTNFAGVKDKTMSDHLVEEIASNPEKVAAAMQVIQLADSLRQKLLSDLKRQLVQKLPGHDVEISDDPWAKYSGLNISFSKESSYRFGMEFQNTQFNGLVIGVSRKIKGTPAHGTEYASLVSNFGSASQNEWWLWWRYGSLTDSLLPIAQNWNSFAAPWMCVANGELAMRITEAFVRLRAVLIECDVG